MFNIININYIINYVIYILHSHNVNTRMHNNHHAHMNMWFNHIFYIHAGTDVNMIINHIVNVINNFIPVIDIINLDYAFTNINIIHRNDIMLTNHNNIHNMNNRMCGSTTAINHMINAVIKHPDNHMVIGININININNIVINYIINAVRLSGHDKTPRAGAVLHGAFCSCCFYPHASISVTIICGVLFPLYVFIVMLP